MIRINVENETKLEYSSVDLYENSGAMEYLKIVFINNEVISLDVLIPNGKYTKIYDVKIK